MNEPERYFYHSFPRRQRENSASELTVGLQILASVSTSGFLLTPEITEKLRHYHKLGDDQIRALHLIFHSIKDGRDDMNLTPGHLAAIRASTLIVHGDRDPFFPLSIGVDMYRAIPGAYLWTVPNGDHIPIVEHAEAFTHTALEFLRGGWQQ